MGDLYELTKAATKLPIGTEEARLYLKSSPAEDKNLGLLLRAAVQHAEGYTGVDFRANTWKLTMDGFPVGGRIPDGALARQAGARYGRVGELVADEVQAIHRCGGWLGSLSGSPAHGGQRSSEA